MNQSELEAKSCNRCQARENLEPVLRAGNYATGAERGITGFCLFVKQHVCCDRARNREFDSKQP